MVPKYDIEIPKKNFREEGGQLRQANGVNDIFLCYSLHMNRIFPVLNSTAVVKGCDRSNVL